MLNALGQVARYGRACLVLGLLAGLALPALAAGMRPGLPGLVALLLFLTALRIGPRAAWQSVSALRRSLGLALALQLALPLLAAGLFWAAGLLQTPLAMALLLMMSAPSVAAAPSVTVMLGHDPAPALRLLILGTAILPLTVLPVFWILPELGGLGPVLTAAGRLMVVILGATLAGFAVRHWLVRDMTPDGQRALDGLTALTLAVIVVALMSAIGPALRDAPERLAWWLLAAFAANFGLQVLAFALQGRAAAAVPLSIVAGNRNIALFLVALPADVTDPLLIFIGCYQFPMYLTPILLRRLYAHAAPA